MSSTTPITTPSGAPWNAGHCRACLEEGTTTVLRSGEGLLVRYVLSVKTVAAGSGHRAWHYCANHTDAVRALAIPSGATDVEVLGLPKLAAAQHA